jgi:hypothetical protein
MLFFIGLSLGLVFFFAGISGAWSRFLTGLRSLRIRRNGTNLDAEILRSRPLRMNRKGIPTAVLIAGHWEWNGQRHTGDFTVPGRWWDQRKGTSIRVRIDPNRPGVAELVDELPNPSWAIVLAVGWLIMAAVGAFFLFRSATGACDPVQYALLEPLCQTLAGG